MQFIALCIYRSFVTNSTVIVKRSHCGHGEAGKASLEERMLKTSLERPNQGLGCTWQSTGMEGCCRRSTVHAEQCKQSRLAFLLSELHLLPLHSPIQLGLITHRTRKRRMIEQGSMNTVEINLCY